MSETTPKNLPVPAVFPQTAITMGDVQVISSTDELFNHVDDNLPMWAEDGDRLVSLDIWSCHGLVPVSFEQCLL